MAKVSKLEAADRQFNAGAELYFNSYDPLIPHALIAAALNVYTDLSQNAGKSGWMQRAAADSNFELSAARSIFNRAWNFLKHADRDPNGILELDPDETEHLAMFATLERAAHGELTRHMEVFQYWYLAKHPLSSNSELLMAAKIIFPGLPDLAPEDQLLAGKRYLDMYREA